MSLGKIITEIATIAQIATANPDSAMMNQYETVIANSTKTEQITQQKPTINPKTTANPFNIGMETGIVQGKEHPISFQRIHVKNEDASIKYDFNHGANDVLQIVVNFPKNFGAAIYNVGDWKNNNMFYAEAWKILEIGQNSQIMIDAGVGKGKNRETELFALGKLTTDKIFAELAIYEKVSELGDVNKSIFAGVGYDFGHAYIGTGKQRDRLMGVTGLKGFKDFGMMNFMLYDTKTNNWSFISQTAAKDVNQDFFHKNLFDFVTEYFSIPSFFPTHFTPQMNKGDYTLKVNGAGKPGVTELEGKLGWNNKILPFSAGINTRNEYGERTIGPVLEVAKQIEFKNGLQVNAEAKYNFRDNTFKAYLIFK